MRSSFNIVFAVAEASPLVKVGGLGDVAGSLPQALRQGGHDVRIIMPQYGIINLEGYQPNWRGSFNIPFMGNEENIGINEVVLKNGIPVYLVENERYFDRQAVYGEADDLERFLLFSLAVMEVPKKLNWQPDILHCHDWHTGMVPALLKTARRNEPFYSNCASIYTIHNLGYQGWFDAWFADRTRLHDYLQPLEDELHHKAYSMTALGIYYSDVISTVSETYAKEILTPEYGMGLESLLQSRKDSLFGILNGIDYEEFNPAVDRTTAANYDFDSLDRRIVNKLALQAEVGLPVNTETPLIGMAGRLVEQKGPDIAAQVLEVLLPETDMQFILQGTGDTRYERLLEKIESQHLRKARVFFVLDFSLARRIFAGCDIFLMPSRFEPCGLSHLIAMHYGAIPVVRRTGGLAETVPDCSPDLSTGLGFVFERYDDNDLLMALRRAVAAYHNKEKWRELMKRVIQADFSWKSAVSKYSSLYQMARHKVVGDDSSVGAN